MTPKEAIQIAKRHVEELYEDEGLVHLGLEEVEYDETSGQWRVTLGFSRIWSPTARLAAQLSGGQLLTGRSMKIVSVSARDGTVVSMKNREPEQA